MSVLSINQCECGCAPLVVKYSTGEIAVRCPDCGADTVEDYQPYDEAICIHSWNRGLVAKEMDIAETSFWGAGICG